MLTLHINSLTKQLFKKKLLSIIYSLLHQLQQRKAVNNAPDWIQVPKPQNPLKEAEPYLCLLFLFLHEVECNIITYKKVRRKKPSTEFYCKVNGYEHFFPVTHIIEVLLQLSVSIPFFKVSLKAAIRIIYDLCMKLMNSWQRRLLNMITDGVSGVLASGFNAQKQAHSHVHTIMELELYQCHTPAAVQGPVWPSEE